jgi:hypothetical protein
MFPKRRSSGGHLSKRCKQKILEIAEELVIFAREIIAK